MSFAFVRTLRDWFGIAGTPDRAGPAATVTPPAKGPATRKWACFVPNGNTGLGWSRRVCAATKSEARAVLKRQFGLDRLPVGTMLEELDRRS